MSFVESLVGIGVMTVMKGEIAPITLCPPINTGGSEKKMKGEGVLHIRFQKIENGADKRGTAFTSL